MSDDGMETEAEDARGFWVVLAFLATSVAFVSTVLVIWTEEDFFLRLALTSDLVAIVTWVIYRSYPRRGAS